jgi:P pilus assembly chaperone PapD
MNIALLPCMARRWIVAGLLALVSVPASADVVLNTTRVVYPAQEHEVTLALTNDEKAQPRLVQAWIDDGRSDVPPDHLRVPFQLTPPVFRIDAGKGQVLRIAYTREDSPKTPLPTDKESLFWLNVLSMPPTPDHANRQSLLQFAIRTRIKLFFRPEGLSGKSEKAPEQLQWKLVSHGAEQALEAYNPSAYHISFASIALVAGDREIHSDTPPILAPGMTARYVLNGLAQPHSGAATVRFKTVDDYGNPIDHTAKL